MKLPGVSHICAECAYYGFKAPNPNGPCTAYCFYWRAWYPDAWVAGKTDPGERTCKKWVQRGAIEKGERRK